MISYIFIVILLYILCIYSDPEGNAILSHDPVDTQAPAALHHQNHHQHHKHHKNQTSCDVCSHPAIDLNQLAGQFHVDVFFMVREHKDYPYILDGSFWYGPKLLKLFSNNSLNKTYVRVHILSDNDNILIIGQKLGFYMHNISEIKYLEEEFFELYKYNHHSVNLIPYEFLCFHRWHMYRYYIEQWNNNTINEKIINIMTIDSDIMFFMNAYDFYYKTLSSLSISFSTSIDVTSSYDMIMISPGALQLWSVPGLINYSKLLYSWYTNKTTDEIYNNTFSLLNSLRPFDKVPYNRSMKIHMSDMDFAKYYAKLNPIRNNICYHVPSKLPYHQRSVIDHCLIEKLGCVPSTHFFEIVVHDSMLWNTNTTGFYGPSEKYPFCFMVRILVIIIVLTL